MAEENNNQGQRSDMQAAAQAAKTTATAVKAAGRAAAGDFLGAAKDLLTDEQIRKAIISIMVCISLLLTGGLLIIGSAITGVITYLCNSWDEHWQENWLETSIESNGSALYRYTRGWMNTLDQTAADVIVGMFTDEHEVDGSDATNKSIDGTTQVQQSDYETTILSVVQGEALSGTNGALMERIDLVKNRMMQRGNQIATYALAQYSLEAIGLSLAEIFINIFQNPILYRGVASASVDVDMTCFKVSDIQALKILAAYSIQKDCAIQDIDMFDLMDYLGWYDVSVTRLESSELAWESIYQGKTEVGVYQDIGTVSSGTTIREDVHGLAPPFVPAWRGTFTPQWYLEEIAQIKDHNADYFNTPEDQRGDMILWGIENEDDELDLSSFKNLDKYKPYGLIDKLYTRSTAELIVTRTEYHGAEEYYLEALNDFAGSIVADLWTAAFGDKQITDAYGNAICRDSDGNHYYLFSNGATGTTKDTYSPNSNTTYTYAYYLKNEATGATTGRAYPDTHGGQIGFYGLEGNTTYSVWEVETICTEQKFQPITPEEPGDGPIANIPSKPIVNTQTNIYTVSSFTTMANKEDNQAYQLNLNLKVSFAARSMDRIVLELMGLWPDSLAATKTSVNGTEYAEKYVGNDNLKKYWTDTYIDPSGTVHTLEFERQQGYQYEAYKDIVEGMAAILGIETSGINAPNHNAGLSIVQVALAEWEYYQANNLYEGGRYWAKVKEVLGWTYPDDTAWCVAFVYCCAYECGYIGEGKVFGPDWVFYVEGAFHNIKNAGKCDVYTTPGEGYQPVPGDLIFFAAPPSGGSVDMTHIGIVEEVDAAGKLHIIHGNAGNRLERSVIASYEVGHIWDASSGVRIHGYIHPYYPVSVSNNMVYLSVGGLTQPTITSRYITADGQNLMISGLTRLRQSQLQDFVTGLQTSYPNLYDPALQTALDSGDMYTFMQHWNALAASAQSETFRSAQFNLFKSFFFQPLVNQVQADTGFKWSETTFRSEMLWSILTSTDQHDVVAELLAELTSGLSNNITDDEFSTILRTNNFLGSTLKNYQERLWPEDNDRLRSSWISGISMTLTMLVSSSGNYGSLTNEFYFAIDNIDPDYQGHAVPELTPSQIAKIKNTLYGEYGSNLGACIMIAQTIRDNVDRKWPDVTYDNFVEEFKYYGGYPERDPSVYETDIVNQVFDYVFVQGGSAVQHPVYCFYTPTDTLQSDEDYQKLFYLPLEFIIEIGVARFFSW